MSDAYESTSMSQLTAEPDEPTHWRILDLSSSCHGEWFEEDAKWSEQYGLRGIRRRRQGGRENDALRAYGVTRSTGSFCI